MADQNVLLNIITYFQNVNFTCVTSNHYVFITPGMVQALVGQKPLKRDILRVFSMSDFIKIKGDYW